MTIITFNYYLFLRFPFLAGFWRELYITFGLIVRNWHGIYKYIVYRFMTTWFQKYHLTISYIFIYLFICSCTGSRGEVYVNMEFKLTSLIIGELIDQPRDKILEEYVKNIRKSTFSSPKSINCLVSMKKKDRSFFGMSCKTSYRTNWLQL